MASPPPVSQRDLARQLGLSQATVSMALAGNPKVSPQTRALVEKAARDCSYRPDPALRSLARYRLAQRPAHFRATLAWVHGWPDRDAWRGSHAYHVIHEAAVQRADRLGYHLENFWLQPERLSGERATRILVSRGIRGLLVLPYTELLGRSALDWDKFCAIHLLSHRDSPQLHMLASDHAQSLRMCLAETRRRGYSRPGLVTARHLEETHRFGYVCAYTGEQAAGQPGPPVLWHEELTREHFAAWLRKHQPDVLLLSYVAESFARVFTWLGELRLRVPEDIGVAMLCLPEPGRKLPAEVPADLSGVDEQFSELGARAIDFLVHLTENFEHGEALTPLRQLVRGRWHDGATLRPAPAPA